MAVLQKRLAGGRHSQLSNSGLESPALDSDYRWPVVSKHGGCAGFKSSRAPIGRRLGHVPAPLGRAGQVMERQSRRREACRGLARRDSAALGRGYLPRSVPLYSPRAVLG